MEFYSLINFRILEGKETRNMYPISVWRCPSHILFRKQYCRNIENAGLQNSKIRARARRVSGVTGRSMRRWWEGTTVAELQMTWCLRSYDGMLMDSFFFPSFVFAFERSNCVYFTRLYLSFW